MSELKIDIQSSVKSSYIVLDSDECRVLLTEKFSKILNVLFDQKIQPSLCFKTCDQVLETFGQVFEALRENQKLGPRVGRA